MISLNIQQMAGGKKTVATEQAVSAEQENQSSSHDEADKKRVVNAVSSDFVKQVKDGLPEGIKLSQKDLKTICEVFVRTLVQQVKAGSSVSFTNNMTFKRVVREDRTHKNPKTGEEVFKPAHYVMSMEVKPSLKRQFEELLVSKKEKLAAATADGGDSGADQDGGGEPVSSDE